MRLRLAALLAAFIFSAGCDAGSATVAPVDGKINFKGVPLRHGTIVFTPDAERGNYGPIAQADIQPDGSYRLYTDGSPGACIGWHRVTVTAVETLPEEGRKQRFRMVRSLLPDKYCDPMLSGLACEVRLDKDNTIHFNLE